MSRKSITAVLEAADATSTSWDDVSGKPEGEAYALLFPGRGDHQSVFAQPEWERVHREMTRVVVTLKLLNGEYADVKTELSVALVYASGSSRSGIG